MSGSDQGKPYQSYERKELAGKWEDFRRDCLRAKAERIDLIKGGIERLEKELEHAKDRASKLPGEIEAMRGRMAKTINATIPEEMPFDLP